MKREFEISPSHVPARVRLAEEYLKEGQIDQGLALAAEALKLAPKDASASMVLGEGLVAKGDIEGGIRELESARDLSPENVRVRWDLVRAYTSAGRGVEAAREKEAIAKLDQHSEQR
jgi:Flp pilus assembly protein TadD